MAIKADHSGHRARMKRRFLENGVDNFHPHEVLEMLLYYAVPMKDTNDLAIRLITHFGSFSAVLDAPIDLLMEFGLTENQATYLKLLPQACRLYLDDMSNSPQKIITKEHIAPYLINKFVGRTEECVLLLLMDRKCKELFCGVISSGSFDTSELSVRKIIDLSLRYGAVYAILAHNHPDGVALPSNADISATRNIAAALHLIRVKLVDHYVIADNDCVSMRDSDIRFLSS